MKKFFSKITSEMKEGNFSFLILIVGVIQIGLMIANLFN